MTVNKRVQYTHGRADKDPLSLFSPLRGEKIQLPLQVRGAKFPHRSHGEIRFCVNATPGRGYNPSVRILHEGAKNRPQPPVLKILSPCSSRAQSKNSVLKSKDNPSVFCPIGAKSGSPVQGEPSHWLNERDFLFTAHSFRFLLSGGRIFGTITPKITDVSIPEIIRGIIFPKT